MQREIGRRLDRLYEERPIHEAILLGKTVSGDSALERIDFLKSFEAPYYSLLERGVPFHAVLSREDDAIAWILTRYPVFQMGERRHYARDFRGGLVRFYALDAVGLRKELEAESEGGAVGDQWSRLTADLESEGARALWRVVALEPPLLSLAEEDATDGLVAERLLPILERHRVQLALWAGEPWHQRVYDPKVGALMLGVGWSGLVRRDATFRSDDPRLQATAQGRPGVTMLEFRPDLMRALAIDVDGETVDAAYFDRAAGPIDPALGAERWSSVSASSEDPAGRD
jgi:hypothetical protein